MPETKEVTIHLLNEKIGRLNLMQEPINHVYAKADTLEKDLFNNVLKYCEPYFLGMKCSTVDAKKYRDGNFKGVLKPIPFLESSKAYSEEELERVAKELDLMLQIYNAYFLAMEQEVFALEHVLKEAILIRNYYFALQLARAVQLYHWKENQLQEQSLGFIPDLSGFGSLLEKKQEEFLQNMIKLIYIGSSSRTTDIMKKSQGDFFLEDYYLLLRNLAEQKEVFHACMNCRMIPASMPKLVRQNYALFSDDDCEKRFRGGI